MRKSLIKAGVLLLIICLSLSSCEFALFGIGWLLSEELEEEEPVAGFSTQPISDEQKAKITENLNITLLTEEPSHRTIQCFDVREDGKIAIGSLNLSNRETVYVYDSGEFLYGFSFITGGTFGIKWNGDNINISLHRSGLLVTVSPQGEVEEILEIPSTADNSIYSRKAYSPKERHIGNNKYIMKNDLWIVKIFAGGSYMQLVAVDETGSTSILYEASNFHWFGIILNAVVLSVLVIVVPIGVAKTCREYF